MKAILLACSVAVVAFGHANGDDPFAFSPQQEKPAPPSVGDRLTAFTLNKRGGATYSWKPGKPAVIAFCAFWCDTWKVQLPRVEEARKKLGGFPLDYLTVSVDGRWSERGTEAAVGLNLSDLGGKWTQSIGVDRVPYTLLIDKEGAVRWTSYGVVRSDALAKAVRSLDKRSTGTVYLTFDDFPAAKGTDALLDLLRARQVPATFFCVCSRLQPYSSVLERAVSEGHRLEVHAWVHDEPRTDLRKCAAALQGFNAARLYRPHGSEKVFQIAGMKPLQNPVVDPYDFKRPGSKELIRRVMHGVKPDSILQFHAGVSDTVEALPEIIDKLRARGFRFGLLGSGQV